MYEKFKINPLYDEKCDKVLTRIASEVRSAKKICDEEKLPFVYFWAKVNKYPEFEKKYARAKVEQSELMAEEIMEIADGAINVIKNGAEKKSGALAASVRLQVESRKWLAAKLKPNKYGEKVDVTSGGEKLRANLPEWYKSNEDKSKL